jgi:hypothetical protein
MTFGRDIRYRKESGELIRQIPPEEILALAKHMNEMRETGVRPDGSGSKEQSLGLLLKMQA